MFGHRSRLPFDPSLGTLMFGPNAVQLGSIFDDFSELFQNMFSFAAELLGAILAQRTLTRKSWSLHR